MLDLKPNNQLMRVPKSQIYFNRAIKCLTRYYSYVCAFAVVLLTYYGIWLVVGGKPHGNVAKYFAIAIGGATKVLLKDKFKENSGSQGKTE